MNPNKPHVAVLFSRIGPYHFARLRAAASGMKVTAVEFSDVDSTYAWDLVAGQDGFDRVTLFSGIPTESLPGARIYEAVESTLNRLSPEVVALPGWFDRCSLAGLKWCARHDVPAVMMSETNAWDEPRKLWREVVKKQVLRLCGAGLAGGQGHADYLAQLGMSRDRIFTGYDAVDNDHFATGADAARNQGDESRRTCQLPEKYFLASARFIEKKNLARLIQAWARYRDLVQHQPSNHQLRDLVILGDGPLKSSLIDLIAHLDAVGHIHLPGFKQYDELPAYYGLASAFIHASTTEQWGLVVNEAMASGLPVMVSNRCGCAMDLVQEDRNGFTFDPLNVEQLAGLMLKMSAQEFPLAAFGSESRQIVDRCSPDRFGETLRAACDRAIAYGLREDSSTRARLLSCGVIDAGIRFSGIVSSRDSEAAGSLVPLQSGQPAGTPVIPNFFIVGAPKSGTTSMCAYLKDHPNVFFCKVKEPHFFDSDVSKQLKLNLATYLSLFVGSDPLVHKAIVEGSTGYLFSKVAISEILKFNPNARFIVFLRSPMDLVRAWHSEMFFEGVENLADFEQAWRTEEHRRQGKSIPRSCWEPKKLFYSEWGKLGDQMERLFSIVDRDRVKVILFDDFVTDTRSAYEEVLSFLGVPDDMRTDFPVINENKALRLRSLQTGLAFLANYFRRSRILSGLKLNLGAGWFSRILTLNSKPGRRKPISPALASELRAFYRQDVKKLSKLIDRDLSAWVAESPQPGEAARLQDRAENSISYG